MVRGSALGADDFEAHRASVVVVVAGSVVGDDLDVHDLALGVDRGGVVERLPRAAVDAVEHAADLGALADERRILDAVPDDVTLGVREVRLLDAVGVVRSRVGVVAEVPVVSRHWA